MKLNIKRLEIDKLFDRFDYIIDLTKTENGIQILTAPNGYGKSTILKIIKVLPAVIFFILYVRDFIAFVLFFPMVQKQK